MICLDVFKPGYLVTHHTWRPKVTIPSRAIQLRTVMNLLEDLPEALRWAKSDPEVAELMALTPNGRGHNLVNLMRIDEV